MNNANAIQPILTSTSLKMLSFSASQRFFHQTYQSRQQANSRYRIYSLPRCSMNPSIDSNNNAVNTNAPMELDSKSTAQPSSTPVSNHRLSSMCNKGLAFDLGGPNSWDSGQIGSPVVKRYIGDNEERWYMWYHGSCPEGNVAPPDSIGLATSFNGLTWERGVRRVGSCGDVGIVMECSKNWWAFDTESIRPSELVIMSSPMYSAVYWLYYTGYGSEEIKLRENCGFTKTYKSLPGLACSQDGRHWARIEGDYHSGAVIDVGSVEEWDSLFIEAPKVVVHSKDDFRMYYHSFEVKNGHFAIGVARSRDGIRWVKLGKIIGGGSMGAFDELGVMNVSVVPNRKEGKYLMAFESVAANGQRSIGLAESPDGLKTWKKVQDGPILNPSYEEGWDNKDVGSPYLVHMQGNTDEWRLYYKGVGRGGRTGIGLAISKGAELTGFKRWEGSNI